MPRKAIQVNLKLCPRGEWQDRLLVETVLSMLTLVMHFKRLFEKFRLL